MAFSRLSKWPALLVSFDAEERCLRRNLTVYLSPSTSPMFGGYYFNNGSSVMAGCGTTRFSRSAAAMETSPSANQTNSASSSGGLSSGASAGLVVGILSGIVTIAGGGWALMRRCRGRSTKPDSAPNKISRNIVNNHFYGQFYIDVRPGLLSDKNGVTPNIRTLSGGKVPLLEGPRVEVLE